jgi:hypothetical protein
MHQEPVPQQPGRDEDPSGVPAGPGDHPWLGCPDWRLVPQSPDWDHTAVLAAIGAVAAGRLGPGMPGSAESFAGEYPSPAAGFASGKPLDTAPGCTVLAQFAEDAAGGG